MSSLPEKLFSLAAIRGTNFHHERTAEERRELTADSNSHSLTYLRSARPGERGETCDRTRGSGAESFAGPAVSGASGAGGGGVGPFLNDMTVDGEQAAHGGDGRRFHACAGKKLPFRERASLLSARPAKSSSRHRNFRQRCE